MLLFFLVCWVISSIVTTLTLHKLSRLPETLVCPVRGSGDFPPVLQCELGRRACSCQPALLSGTDSPVASGVPHGPCLLCEPVSSGPVARVSRLSVRPPGSLRSGCCPLLLDSQVALQVWPPGLLLPWVWTTVLSLTPRSCLRARCSSHLDWGGAPP